MRLHTNDNPTQQPRSAVLHAGLQRLLRQRPNDAPRVVPQPPMGQDEPDLRDLDQRVRESGEW